MSRGKIIRNVKIMLSVNEEVYNFLKSRADARGVRFQEYVRMIFGQYFVDNGGLELRKHRIIEVPPPP